MSKFLEIYSRIPKNFQIENENDPDYVAQRLHQANNPRAASSSSSFNVHPSSPATYLAHRSMDISVDISPFQLRVQTIIWKSFESPSFFCFFFANCVWVSQPLQLVVNLQTSRLTCIAIIAVAILYQYGDDIVIYFIVSFAYLCSLNKSPEFLGLFSWPNSISTPARRSCEWNFWDNDDGLLGFHFFRQLNFLWSDTGRELRATLTQSHGTRKGKSGRAISGFLSRYHTAYRRQSGPAKLLEPQRQGTSRFYAFVLIESTRRIYCCCSDDLSSW